LAEPTWNATRIGIEDIEELDGNLLVAGSRQLVQALFEHELAGSTSKKENGRACSLASSPIPVRPPGSCKPSLLP
jgi:hypothetical protein